MLYDFFDAFFKRHPVKAMRLLEIIPPLIAISIISLPFIGSVFFPVVVSYFIIFFDVFWLYKSFSLAFYAYAGTRKVHQAEKEDWLAKAKEFPNFDKINHIIVIPNYKEKKEKLEETLKTMQLQTFPHDRLYIVLAMEKREEEAMEKAVALQKEFNHIFKNILYTVHPMQKGEIAGKSSNQAYAAREAYPMIIEKHHLDIDFVTITTTDADAKFDPQYFAFLAHGFLSSPAPHLRIWQSAIVFYNNFWQVPSFTRIMSFFGSLGRTALLLQKMKLLPHATYSLSFKLLKDIGYWDADVIPEDYRTFFKAFFATQGKVEVDPIFLATSMDAAQSATYKSSLVNRYNQERRWAWGVSDVAVYFKWGLTVKGISFLRKAYLLINVLTDHVLWPSYWYIITISANLVVIFNPVFSRSSLGYTLPRLSGFILTICLLSLVGMMYVDYVLQSKRYASPSKLHRILFPLEFLLMPIAGFFFSSLPALISHIQLIRGKRLEYKVTEKV
jgi:cellulose synthase/poly-beta-1,6-N-acetylglucosamine synthase-like glycosyltransferase